ncbi:hypothetical protein [Mycolicibacterium setense]|uniref:hypothetical protein n=1 Tax=Mycolicibacterium setense TaxID=431269 RepID=UPI001F43258A|nr:hypothetical protein [Mycolicibacterium setense]
MSAMLVIVPAVSAAPAYAEPVDVPPPPEQPSLTLPGPELGMKSEIFVAPENPENLSVPVPAGLTAVRLRGTIKAPVNFDAGTLDISDDGGKLLAAIDLPPGASSRPTTPLDVDISAARRGSPIGLTFALRPRFDPQMYTNSYCWPRQQLVLSDLSMVFTGSESPATTIADFFPPVLQRATIYTPVDANTDEQQAVLTLVSTLARLYSNQPTVITVVTQPRGAVPPPAGELTRAVLVEKGDKPGLQVENPGAPDAFLRVSGQGAALSTQLSLLVNKLQRLAQVDTVRVDQAGSSEPGPRGDTMTFGELNMTGSTDVIRSATMSVGVGRASLGSGRFDAVQVHLLADYAPVARDDAAAVVIRSGGVVVYRAALDDTGRLDATFDLDSKKIGQYITLDMALTYTPREACGLLIPLTFEVNPQSTLTVHRGGQPLDGFSAIPSEFSPKFMVAMDGSAPNQLATAARLVVSIARFASTPVMPQVVDLNTAAGASIGALILANSAALKPTSLKPPIGGDGTAIDVELPTVLRASIKGGLGSIQAFADRPRDRSVLLVTTTGPWTLVDPVFSYLDGFGGDFSKLTGDVLAAGVGGDPVNLAVGATDNPADAAQTSAQSHSRRLLVGAAVAVVAALGAAASAMWSRRRRTTGGAAD